MVARYHYLAAYTHLDVGTSVLASRRGRSPAYGVVSAQGKIALGLTAGPVPPRVDAIVKAGVLDLIDHAVDHGWSARAACPS